MPENFGDLIFWILNAILALLLGVVAFILKEVWRLMREAQRKTEETFERIWQQIRKHEKQTERSIARLIMRVAHLEWHIGTGGKEVGKRWSDRMLQEIEKIAEEDDLDNGKL